MYMIYNPYNVFYSYDLSKNYYYLIGNYYDFIDTLSKKIICVCKEKPHLPSSYDFDYSDIALNENDLKAIYPFFLNTLNKIPIYSYRKTMYLDKMGRILDPRNYLEEAILRYINNKNPKANHHWLNKYRHHYRKLGHSCYNYKNRHSWGYYQAKKLKSKYNSDVEYKDYSFKKNIYKHKNEPSDWWDERIRKIEGNWKSQYKVNKQYNIHTHQKKSDTIRKMHYHIDYTQDEIDFMLEEDFLKGENI